MMSLSVWLPGPMFLLEGLYPWFDVPSRSLCQGGYLYPGGSLCRESLPPPRIKILSCNILKSTPQLIFKNYQLLLINI